MDDGLSHAVRKVFVDLHKQGLIYRDQRLVNWDPKLQTAISDLEVQNPEVKGHLWHIRYPSRASPIATSSSPPRGRRRCWAIPPSPSIRTTRATRTWSARPWCCRWSGARSHHRRRLRRSRDRHRRAEDHARPRFNDFESAAATTCRASHFRPLRERQRKRAGSLPRPRPLRGPQARGGGPGGARPLEKVEDHTHKVPHGDRGNVPARALAHRPVVRRRQDPATPAIKAVEEGRTRFVPEQ